MVTNAGKDKIPNTFDVQLSAEGQQFLEVFKESPAVKSLLSLKTSRANLLLSQANPQSRG